VSDESQHPFPAKIQFYQILYSGYTPQDFSI